MLGKIPIPNSPVQEGLCINNTVFECDIPCDIRINKIATKTAIYMNFYIN